MTTVTVAGVGGQQLGPSCLKWPSWHPYRDQRQWRQRPGDDLIALCGTIGGTRECFRAGDTTMPLSQHNHINRGKGAVAWAVRGFGQVRYGHEAGSPSARSAG